MKVIFPENDLGSKTSHPVGGHLVTESYLSTIVDLTAVVTATHSLIVTLVEVGVVDRLVFEMVNLQ